MVGGHDHQGVVEDSGTLDRVQEATDQGVGRRELPFVGLAQKGRVGRGEALGLGPQGAVDGGGGRVGEAPQCRRDRRGDLARLGEQPLGMVVVVKIQEMDVGEEGLVAVPDDELLGRLEDGRVGPCGQDVLVHPLVVVDLRRDPAGRGDHAGVVAVRVEHFRRQNESVRQIRQPLGVLPGTGHDTVHPRRRRGEQRGDARHGLRRVAVGERPPPGGRERRGPECRRAKPRRLRGRRPAGRRPGRPAHWAAIGRMAPALHRRGGRPKRPPSGQRGGSSAAEVGVERRETRDP